MIKIISFKKELQEDTKKFVIDNMKNELNINRNTLIKIVKDLDDIEENYIQKGGIFLVAYDYLKRKIIGTIAYTFEGEFAILKRFYVEKESRKKKIGFLLYKKLEEIIKTKGIKEIYLVSGKELEDAHIFYERNGWIEEKNTSGIFVRDGAILYKKIMEEKNMKDYKILKDLIGFNTIKDKENKKIIDYIENYLNKIGFKTEYKTKALVMSIGENPKLGFLGHTDTVEYIKEFDSPFDLKEKDNYLYGLGVCDMKGGIAAMLEAVSEIDFNKLQHGFKFYLTYDEEICFSGIYELLKKKEVYPRIYDLWGTYR